MSPIFVVTAPFKCEPCEELMLNYRNAAIDFEQVDLKMDQGRRRMRELGLLEVPHYPFVAVAVEGRAFAYLVNDDVETVRVLLGRAVCGLDGHCYVPSAVAASHGATPTPNAGVDAGDGSLAELLHEVLTCDELRAAIKRGGVSVPRRKDEQAELVEELLLGGIIRGADVVARVLRDGLEALAEALGIATDLLAVELKREIGDALDALADAKRSDSSQGQRGSSCVEPQVVGASAVPPKMQRLFALAVHPDTPEHEAAAAFTALRKSAAELGAVLSLAVLG